ncbi:hypothetical protein TKK_0000894 [Trichogramma kaykai]
MSTEVETGPTSTFLKLPEAHKTGGQLYLNKEKAEEGLNKYWEIHTHMQNSRNLQEASNHNHGPVPQAEQNLWNSQEASNYDHKHVPQTEKRLRKNSPLASFINDGPSEMPNVQDCVKDLQSLSIDQENNT